jgi:hypothetical protein
VFTKAHSNLNEYHEKLKNKECEIAFNKEDVRRC